MRSLALAGFIGCLIAAPAAAQHGVLVDSSVYVERTSHTNDGRIMRRIEPASRLVRGDKVVLVVEWRTDADGKPFAVTSPIPGTLKFERSGQEGEQVSVDGGVSWGDLGEIKVREGSGTRLASAADVTHVRWQVSGRDASRGSGRITYSAVVR
jgi:hypothetical protein